MFGRGNWAIFKIDPNQYNFVTLVSDRINALAISQLSASAVVRLANVQAVGINPFGDPRLDETEDLSPEDAAQLVWLRQQSLDRIHEAVHSPEAPSDFTTLQDGYGHGAAAFRLDENRYGFWFVQNEWLDVGHEASTKEGIAYDGYHQPFKFLPTGDKRTVDSQAKVTSAWIRKQFPVLIDFSAGYVFAETTNKTQLSMLQNLLADTGVKTIDVAWLFGDGDWIRNFLNHVHDDSHFKNAYQKRAVERTKVGPDQVEKLEDAELEKIVSKTFAMVELETEDWIGLSTPAQIKLHPKSDMVTVQSVTNATTLLNISDAAQIYSASLVFQERDVAVNKKGEERVYRNTTFTLDLNDGINDMDTGVALLRGFDLPNFKRAIKRTIRKTKQIPTIAEFWNQWLTGLRMGVTHFTVAVSLVLELDLEGKVGVVPLFKPEAEEALTGILREMHADGITVDVTFAAANQ